MDQFNSDQPEQPAEQRRDVTGPPTPPSQPVPPSPPRGPRWGLIVGIIVAVFIFFGGLLLLMVIGVASSLLRPADSARGPKVGVVAVSGLISADGGGSLLFGGPQGSRSIMAHLREAAADNNVKAVVLRINSPGGTVGASQAIYEEVARLAEKKPVVVSMGDVAASGGYYVAAPADVIVANPGTITGSIGVVFETLTFYDLMEKVGLDNVTVASGKYKDTGSPFRPMRSDERELLEEMLDDIYEQFVNHVATARDMDLAEVKKLADGRIYSGAQAKEVGLVDELGNFHDAVRIAAEKGGIPGKPALKEYGRGSPLQMLLGEAAAAVVRELRAASWQQASELLLRPSPQPQLR